MPTKNKVMVENPISGVFTEILEIRLKSKNLDFPLNKFCIFIVNPADSIPISGGKKSYPSESLDAVNLTDFKVNFKPSQ